MTSLEARNEYEMYIVKVKLALEEEAAAKMDMIKRCGRKGSSLGIPTHRMHQTLSEQFKDIIEEDNIVLAPRLRLGTMINEALYKK
jgi:hypothetical protein